MDETKLLPQTPDEAVAADALDTALCCAQAGVPSAALGRAFGPEALQLVAVARRLRRVTSDNGRLSAMPAYAPRLERRLVAEYQRRHAPPRSAIGLVAPAVWHPLLVALGAVALAIAVFLTSGRTGGGPGGTPTAWAATSTVTPHAVAAQPSATGTPDAEDVSGPPAASGQSAEPQVGAEPLPAEASVAVAAPTRRGG